VRDLGDRNFEVFCLQLLAVHSRLTGRLDEARQRLADALATARKLGFGDRVPSLLLDDGRTLVEQGEYGQALQTFEKGLADGSPGAALELRIELARLKTRLGDYDDAQRALDQIATEKGSAAANLAPRLAAARGDLAYARGETKEARAAFERASKLWTDELPDAASVEARAYLGFLDGPRGVPMIAESVAQAARMKRPAVEAVARVLLAQAELRGGRPTRAQSALADVPVDVLSPEWRARVHYWRAEARDRVAAGSGADDRRDARKWLDEAERRVPVELRERYLSKADLQGVASLGH